MQLLEPHGKSFFGTKQVFHKPKIDFPWGINNARVLLDDEQRNRNQPPDVTLFFRIRLPDA